MANKMTAKRRKRRKAKRTLNAGMRGEVTIKRRDGSDRVTKSTGSGFHSPKSGNKGYSRHPKHKGQDNN